MVVLPGCVLIRPGAPYEVIGPWSVLQLGRSRASRCDSPQLAAQQLHEQAVVPAAVRPALVLAHDPDAPEPGALVAADRHRVVRRRIDGEPVVAALVQQPARDRPDRVGAEAAAVPV